jgi:hypothetical protein
METTINVDYYEELKSKADKYDNGKIIIDLVENIIIRNATLKNATPLPFISYSYWQELVEKVKEYEEKEKPRKPKVTWQGGNMGKRMLLNGVCKCGEEIDSFSNNYCNWCGVKLDWK